MKQRLLIVYTGNGKGKTSAAMGLVLRALGHKQKVCVIQFIKGSWKSGEAFAAERYSDLLDFHIKGRGFTWKSTDLEKDREQARNAWEFAKESITGRTYRLVVLDELTYLMKYNIIDDKEVVDFLCRSPPETNIVVTGRDAPPNLVSAADIVTYMAEIRHPFKDGIKAQKGIDY